MRIKDVRNSEPFPAMTHIDSSPTSKALSGALHLSRLFGTIRSTAVHFEAVDTATTAMSNVQVASM